MKNPLQMYSKIGDLKIIQIKKEKKNELRNLSRIFVNSNPNGISNNPILNKSSLPVKNLLSPLNITTIPLKSKLDQTSIQLKSREAIESRRNSAKTSIKLPPNLPLLAGKKSLPLHPFIGSLNKKLTTGIIVSSKINQLRKDGMSFKYFRYNYLLSQDIGKLSKQPLTYEYKLSSSPLLAKKYIKIINGYSFYDFNILNLIG